MRECECIRPSNSGLGGSLFDSHGTVDSPTSIIARGVVCESVLSPVGHRYQRGSILITTNKGIRDWPEVLAGDEVLATAILDRLLHNSHVLDIKGRSYRLRDLKHAVTQSSN